MPLQPLAPTNPPSTATTSNPRLRCQDVPSDGVHSNHLCVLRSTVDGGRRHAEMLIDSGGQWRDGWLFQRLHKCISLIPRCLSSGSDSWHGLYHFFHSGLLQMAFSLWRIPSRANHQISSLNAKAGLSCYSSPPCLASEHRNFKGVGIWGEENSFYHSQPLIILPTRIDLDVLVPPGFSSGS